MNEIRLSSDQLFWIIMVSIIGFVIGWTVTFIALRDRDEQMKMLLMDGNLIRVLTVMFIVFATTVLAALNSLSQAVSAMFAGIVGYVLGSMHPEARGSRQKTSQ